MTLDYRNGDGPTPMLRAAVERVVSEAEGKSPAPRESRAPAKRSVAP